MFVHIPLLLTENLISHDGNRVDYHLSQRKATADFNGRK